MRHFISGLGLGLGLETSGLNIGLEALGLEAYGLGLETPGLVNIPGYCYAELAVFVPNGGRNHRQYSLRLPTEGWPG